MIRATLVLLLSIFPLAAKACEGIAIEDSGVYTGPLCLADVPRRVVVLDASFGLGIGMDVGLPIVGAPLERMSDAALHARAVDAKITSLGFVTEPSLETLVALQPDLIVGFVGSESMASGIYPMVSQLAPTLLYTSTDWRAFYRLMAGLTGREAAVASQLSALDDRIAEVAARMPETTVSVVRITSWDFQVYLDSPGGYAPFNIMRQAGVNRSTYETTDNPSEALKRPDWEQLAQLDGDVLLYIVGGTNDSDKDGRHEEVLANPLWQMLPAVQAGRVHRVDHGHWMQFSGLASAHAVLDDLERYVIGPQ
ncbi:iron-siderophore ABC transporter substrate-binding protein [Oceanicola sp. 502str15]|uniref:iron-siderophore ABC transporter substrate-binding protein n=1 Tax=Oceanicola sp. 502str15 TaxID=2696061 RepID=UPI0020953591|nr:iron-siderophore ABC transporter substrate-binding protein [Oceanicola sp. 502str15]MCO6384129.1 ABC transporter substrate-binding protein [Oceanicola sp. 502str15]